MDNMDARSDIEIVGMVLRGNSAAYSILLDRYRNYVFTIVSKNVSSREAAEEISQDVFLKAYRFLADFNGDSKFSTWLYTIANNTALSHLRKKGLNTINVEPAIIEQLDRAVSAANAIDAKTEKKMIQTALAKLPDEDARILTLYYLAEQSVDEISVIMGITAGNVKIRLFRARSKMKSVLERDFKKELI